MDYEKAYKEVLERAREYLDFYKDNPTQAQKFIDIFPELRESEDERIRKYLIDELKAAKSVGELKFIIPQPTREECIAYLEKQKGRKFDFELIKQAWYMEGYKDREFGKESRWIIKTGDDGQEYEENPKYGQMLEAEQKPAWKPSEEQMEELKEASTIVACNDDHIAFPSLKSLYEQLKKL